MRRPITKADETVICSNCITGKTEELLFRDAMLERVMETKSIDNNLFIGPGLIDLQINGINGLDFNTPSLLREDMVKATHYLLSQGITRFFPTIITNTDENMLAIANTIYQACISDPMLNECIAGIHLEGPFISPVEGARGAHDAQYIKAPDWDLFSKFQKAAGGKIKIVTIAPEWEGACAFIEKCRKDGILVSMGHSMANTEQIDKAIKAGMTLSTHLGNGIPLLLPRHPNMIWDQLAAEELYACIITDGVHIPDSFIKVVMKNKGKSTLLVSDATCFAGMPPGEYQNHIGGAVIVDEEKRVSLKGSPGLLAGAGKSLLENVETLLKHHLASLADAWQMASTHVADMLIKNDPHFSEGNNDWVLFKLNGQEIQIVKTIKNGRVVFEH